MLSGLDTVGTVPSFGQWLSLYMPCNCRHEGRSGQAFGGPLPPSLGTPFKYRTSCTATSNNRYISGFYCTGRLLLERSLATKTKRI